MWRDTSIGCHQHEIGPRLGIELETKVYALDWEVNLRPFSLRVDTLTTKQTGQGWQTYFEKVSVL